MVVAIITNEMEMMIALVSQKGNIKGSGIIYV
jgi:hypothetical protein